MSQLSDQAGTFAEEEIITPVFHYDKNTVEVPIPYMAYMIKENNRLKKKIEELQFKLQTLKNS